MRIVRLHAVIVAVICTACGGTPPSQSKPPVATDAQTRAFDVKDANVAATVERILGSAEHPALRWSAISDVVETLKPLYEAEADRLLWFAGPEPSAALPTTITTVAAAANYGLDPADYDADRLSEVWEAVRAGTLSGPQRAHFDLGVSVAVARLLKAAQAGRIDPTTMQWGYEVATKTVDAGAGVRTVAQGKPLSAVLDSLEPPFAHYRRARTALASYRQLASTGEPDLVPDLPKGQAKLEPGKSWSGLQLLTARLIVLGDLAAQSAPTTVYAGPIVDGVKRFQQRHGLEVDGILGAGTIKALNVPLSARVRQIELAMERMRWLPPLTERPNVFVNVPLFRLWATDPTTGEEPLRMNVVVGKSMNHRTPIFIELMEYVVFRPYWYAPRGITVQELVPQAQKDPGYFGREALEIVASGERRCAGPAGDA